jgi:hypothetical protein
VRGVLGLRAAATARAGAQRARPALRELYETRASAYRDGVREFVLGYREAFRDTLLQARAPACVMRLSSAARAVALTAFSSSCAQEAARVQQEAARRRDVDATAGQARPLDAAPAAGGAAAPGTATSQASTADGVPPSPRGG